MAKKILHIIIIIVVLVCGLTAYFSYNSNFKIYKDNNNNNNDNINFKNVNNKSIEFTGEKTNINGLTTLIPEKYANGTIKTNSGIETYGKYDDDSIYITVYDDSPQGNKVYQGDIDYFAYGIANKDNNPKRENISFTNHTILYVTQHSNIRGDYRLAFFEVKGKKVLIEWLGNEISPEIENIISSFYKLN